MNMVGRFTISCCFVLAIPAAFAQTAPIAVAPAAPAAPLADAKPITLESFAATPFIESPRLSPNGRYLATKIASNGEQFLTMTPIFKGNDKPMGINIGGDDVKTDVDWWDWVNDDWLLVGISGIQIIEGTKVRIRRLLSINRLTGKINRLAKEAGGYNAADVLWMAKDGTPRILVGVQNSIYDSNDFWPAVTEIDVSNGRSKRVQPPRVDFLDYYADASGAVRLAYGYNDSARVGTLLYRPDAKATFKKVDRADYKKKEELIAPNLFLAAPNQALTIGGDDDHDAVYELDLTTMTRGKKVFGVPGYDVDSLISTPSGDALAGVAYTDDSARVHWLDPEIAEIQASLDKAVSPRRAVIESWSRDQNILLVHVGAANTPGAYFTYDRNGSGAMQRFAFVDDTLKTRKFATVTTIRYKARDGLEIPAILTLPSGRSPKNLPLILLPHGGPHVRDAENWDWQAQFLAWRGYAVIQPNYRGSTGFGDAFLQKGDGEWGLKMQDDLNDAITHLAKAGTVDPKRVCIMGGSYGGYAALRAAQRDGGLFKCAISFAGVSDIASMRRYDGQFLNGNSARNYWKEQTPDLDAVSPLKHPQDFGTPTLIIHGKNDLRVPVDQSRDMASKLKGAGKVYRYVEQPKGDHHFSRQADRLQFLQEMQAWLDLYNPVDVK